MTAQSASGTGGIGAANNFLEINTARDGSGVLNANDNALDYIEHMRLDKKAVGGDIQFVVIDQPGKAAVQGAPDALVRDVIDACCA